MSLLPGDGEMFPLVVKPPVIGHLLITPLHNKDNIYLRFKSEAQPKKDISSIKA